jgi:hypothetical protein
LRLARLRFRLNLSRPQQRRQPAGGDDKLLGGFRHVGLRRRFGGLFHLNHRFNATVNTMDW